MARIIAVAAAVDQFLATMADKCFDFLLEYRDANQNILDYCRENGGDKTLICSIGDTNS